MRKSTLLWLVLAAFCGTALFHTSQKVHDERTKLAALKTSISHEKQSIRVLKAEWAYLNNPHRLETLAKTYLHMAPLTGSQFIRIDDIPLRPASPTSATAPIPPARHIARKKSSPTIKTVPHRIAAVERPTTLRIRAHKPDIPRIFKKQPPPPQGTTTARNFSDVMKSLNPGVE